MFAGKLQPPVQHVMARTGFALDIDKFAETGELARPEIDIGTERQRIAMPAGPSGETGRGTTVVAGTVAAGEPRITRLDDYRLDMAPADSMLITRHMDRPGTVGRVGIMLGEADINISAMHLARTRPREDAFMILALDDEVPETVSEAIRQQEAVRDLWTIRLGGTR